MSLLKLRKQFANTQSKKQDRQNYDQALCGHPDGTLYVGTDKPGYIWARLNGVSGRLIQVNARGFLAAYNLPIMVTHPPYRKDDWQIVDLNYEGFPGSGTGETPVPWDGNNHIGPHANQHYVTGGDAVFIDISQWLPLVVQPSSGMIIVILQGVLPRLGTDVLVATQTLDLTSNIPASGARYVLLSLDSSGVLTATNGATVGVASLTISDVPDTPAGNLRICAVRVFAGQTSVRGPTSPANDILDLRWPQEIGSSGGNAINQWIYFFGLVGTIPSGFIAYPMNPFPDGGILTTSNRTNTTAADVVMYFVSSQPISAGLISGGVVKVVLKAYKTGSDDSRLFFELYTYHVATAASTLIVTSLETANLTGSSVEYTLMAAIADTIVDPNDYVFVRIIADMHTGAGSNVVSIEHDGTTNSRLILPSSSTGSGSIPLADTHLLVGNAANIAADVALSGDATLTDAGVLTLATLLHDLTLLGDGAARTILNYLYETSASHAPAFAGFRARGSLASPSAVQDTDPLNRFSGRGYHTSGGAGFPSSSTGRIDVVSSETQTSTAYGTRIEIYITPNGSTTIALAATIDQDKSLALVGNLGLNGAAAPAQSTGWAVTGGYTPDKAFDPEATTLTEVARALGTLIDYLKTRGDLGA